MLWMWIGFSLLVIAMLAIDLGVFHRKDHVVSPKEALIWTGVWIAAALAFSLFVYFAYENHWAGLGNDIDDAVGVPTTGKAAVLKYLSGYLLEKTLSVDNIFVISVIFGAFAIPAQYQHRVLFWGVIGALLMRAVMILAGTELIENHHWVVYVFGVLLIATAIKMLVVKTKSASPKDNAIIRWARRIFPMTPEFHGTRLFVFTEIPADGSAKARRVFALTPLALALIVVEATDLLFAVDSVPAIFAITSDPFLIFTSNVFAMLGLRSLYFALAGMIERFRYLKVSLAVLLGVVGVKMLISKWLLSVLGSGFEIWLLAVVLLILGTGVLASWVADRRGKGR